MTTTGHPVAAEELMAFVDGELTGADARVMAEHVASCAECAELTAELRQMSVEFAAWTVEEAPVAVERAVTEAVSKREGRPRMSFGFWKVGGAALSAAVIGVVIWVGVASQSAKRHRYVDEQELTLAQRAIAPRADENGSTSMIARPESSSTYADAPAPVVEPQPAAGLSDAPPPPPPPAKVPAEGRESVGVPKLRVDGAAVHATMIARTVTLELIVPDVTKARRVLEATLARHEGYAATLTVSAEGDYGRELHASLRVPSGELASALAEIKALGKVGQESQSGEDVSHQQRDLETRLKTARATEDSFRAILERHSGTVSDVMEVEENIERVRGDIEEMEAEEKNLQHRVDYATIDLAMTQATAQTAAPSAMRQMRDALRDGWRLAGDVLLGVLLFAGQYGLAILIWMGLLGVPGWMAWRRYRKMRDGD